MTRNEFKKHIEKTLLELKKYTELLSGKELPNDFEFEWHFDKKMKVTGKHNVIELISEKAYLAESNIYSCVDLIVEKVTDGNRILISRRITGYEPREYGKVRVIDLELSFMELGCQLIK